MGIDANTAAMVKERAEDLFAKGRLTEALAAYEKIKACGGKDPRIYLRMGDIARKMENNQSAEASYKGAAEAFARLGFAIKAIAVCKMLISMDPALEEFQERITRLCSGGKDAPSDAARAVTPEKPPEEAMMVPRVPLFSDLSEAEYLAVVKKVRSRTLNEGEYLFREGDAGDSIFFIAEGAVTPAGKARDGAEVEIASLKEGGVFGEFGFFSNARRSTGVKASRKTVVLELTKADLDEVISRHKRVEEILFDFYKDRVVDRLMALSPVFMPMKEEDRKEILKRVTLVRFDPGTLIMKEGETGDTMYLIKDGSVSVWARDVLGTQMDLAELMEGDFFGEIALATNKPRFANVTSKTPVSLIEFPRQAIKDVLIKYPEIKAILSKVITERVSGVISARYGRAALL
ncbi:MAG: cyclic nucleotide-binding domain-containing protein [Deltaproteobacteria bacterium]|nr:cyclic nucleotide-binding domain-containing protein [Deltaproteobacteria bacterium]